MASICCFPEKRCNGSILEISNADATGFESLQDCGSAALCDSNLGACMPGCRPGETRCNGADLQRCDATGTSFETLSQCATAALCSASEGQAHCNTGCAPGETRCFGSSLMRCNDGRTGYETVEQCPAGCGSGACLPADAGAADAH